MWRDNEAINDEQAKRLHLRALVKAAREAQTVGTMHALWDVIFDAEAWMCRTRTILSGSRDEVYAQLVKMFEASGVHVAHVQEAQVKVE